MRGSHKWGKWFHPKKFETENKYVVEKENTNRERVFEDIPNINEDDFDIIKWACEVSNEKHSVFNIRYWLKLFSGSFYCTHLGFPN